MTATEPSLATLSAEPSASWNACPGGTIANPLCQYYSFHCYNYLGLPCHRWQYQNALRYTHQHCEYANMAVGGHPVWEWEGCKVSVLVPWWVIGLLLLFKLISWIRGILKWSGMIPGRSKRNGEEDWLASRRMFHALPSRKTVKPEHETMAHDVMESGLRKR